MPARKGVVAAVDAEVAVADTVEVAVVAAVGREAQRKNSLSRRPTEAVVEAGEAVALFPGVDAELVAPVAGLCLEGDAGGLGWHELLDDLEDVLDREFWHFDYIYNADDDINTSVTGYRHAVATGVYLENGPFSLAADVMYATGEVDVWGATIMPAIFLVEDKLQLVGRYHFADTDDTDGLSLRPRYEQQAPELTDIRGDQYHSFYAGLNYYLYGNRVKLMTGLEFASMKDQSDVDISLENYRGFTWLTGINMSF